MYHAPAAHRIPPETVANIIGQLSFDARSIMIPAARGKLDALYSCSLVCLYWARVSRPAILEHIVVRRKAHLDRLLELLSTSSPVTPSLADCIQAITVDDAGAQQKPWVHRIPRIQDYTRSAIRWSTLKVRDVDGPWISLAGHVPRTIPGSVPQFRSLTFTNVRLRRVRDLLRAVRDLRLLKISTS